MVCPTLHLITVMGKKWTPMVLQGIYLYGDKGFNFLRNRLDITPKILSQRLKELEQQDLIKQTITSQTPPQSRYILTQKGKEFYEIIQKLKIWHSNYLTVNKGCEHTECTTCQLFLDKELGLPL